MELFEKEDVEDYIHWMGGLITLVMPLLIIFVTYFFFKDGYLSAVWENKGLLIMNIVMVLISILGLYILYTYYKKKQEE